MAKTEKRAQTFLSTLNQVTGIGSSAFPYQTKGSHYWPGSTNGTWAGPSFQWQDTTSNATYCSASAALAAK